MKKSAWMLACLAMAQPALLAAAERRAPARRTLSPTLESRALAEAPDVVGTITYDTGNNAGFHPDTGMAVVGNRFNSALGGPLLTTGMVTMITLFPQQPGNQSWSFWGPPSPANTAMLIPGSIAMANLLAAQFNAVTLPTPVSVGPDFLATFFGFYGGTPSGLLGMDDMTVNGQGFHAVAANYNAPNLTMVTPVANRNAMMRVRGDILTPVELMDFKIQ